MSVQKGSLLAALCLITLCTASALTVPSTVLRLVNGHMNIVPVLEEPERPQWPAQYQVSWQFCVPYVSKLQTMPLTYNYTVYQDTAHGRQKIVKDSVDTLISVVDSNTMYEIYPVIDEMKCDKTKLGNSLMTHTQAAAITGRQQQVDDDDKPQLGFVLPDLKESRWAYNGTAMMHDQEANVWIMHSKEELGYGDVISTYTMYVGKDGTPLQFHMLGIDLYMNSHFDDWIVDIAAWQPGPIDDENWRVPDMCHQAEAQELQRHRLDSSLAMEVAKQLPNRHSGDKLYDAFVHRHGRRHATRNEYDQRSQRFHENKEMIKDHNHRGDQTHSLALNRFADWHKEEFLATMLPNHGKPRPALPLEGQQALMHKPRVPKHMLPTTVDWRGSGADSPVKDQASCGSCWAFGTIGAVEAAYFRETGKQLLLSEQDLMDCGWYKNNKACFGGYQDLGLQWLLDKGRVASEEGYPYQGVNNFCTAKGRDHIKFSGDFVTTDGSEYALKEALFTKGPLTVSVDAAPDSFVFYSSGIYNNTACHSEYKDLDHAVLVSGYGTTEDGHDYWLVKNTWSALWGDKGFIKIARNPQDCGIKTQPMYVELRLK
ncbi:hypothetical protein ABBQ38_001497 [Trebouxia sp. C0009 RCD-2024]